MESLRWQRVHEIFTKAADLAEDQRQAAVEEMCAGDAELMTDVMTLLAEDSKSHALLDQGLDTTARNLLSEWAIPSQVQKQIGPYHVLKLLGEGGMGVVYLAERTDIGGFVAIKILRDAWLSPMRRRRFELEEATLAQLTHPAIARIYDANALTDGTPWFVMEYVDGLPITQYCSTHNTSIRDRLRLMRKVCEAVQYAHSHAIIHRDLKPSNILVTSAGEVKLLDFGIAKQLDARESGENRTLTNFRMLTPAYAAPEQKASGAVGVYSDVYALGVLLCELLTGQSPAADVNNPNEAPKPPSLCVRRDSGATFHELTRSEWKDLDALTSKARETLPELRYATVDALIRDLDSFSEGRPLSAQPAKFSYTIGKFVRRHRTALAMLSATLLFVSATILFYTFRLAQARTAAQRETARTLRIQQFTESLFDGGDKSAGPAKDMLVTELLERGRQEAANLKNDPVMQADMQETLGGIYYKLGKLDSAEPLLQAALQEQRSEANVDSGKVANTLVALALVRKDQGQLDAGEKLAREAIQIEAASPKRSGSAAVAMVALGRILNVHGKYDEAISVLDEAMKLQPHDNAATATTAENLVELANAHFYRGDYGVAEKLNRDALAIDLRLFGPRHPSVADVHNNLGAINMNRGNYVAAEKDNREALAISEQWYGPNHPETAANLTALAQTVSYEKRDDEAEMLLNRALEIQKNSVGPVSSTVATTINQLGLLAYNRDHYDAAKSYFTEAMDIWSRLYGEDHQFVAVAYSNLGSVCLSQKDFVCAEKMFRESVRRLDHETAGNANDAIAHLKLGRTLLRQGRFADAEPETTTAYTYLVKQTSPSNSYLTAARKDLAAIYDGLHDSQKAAYYRAELNRPAATQ